LERIGSRGGGILNREGSTEEFIIQIERGKRRAWREQVIWFDPTIYERTGLRGDGRGLGPSHLYTLFEKGDKIQDGGEPNVLTGILNQGKLGLLTSNSHKRWRKKGKSREEDSK